MKKILLATLANFLFFNSNFHAQTPCDTLFLKNGETRLVSIWEENFEGSVCEICPNDGHGDRFLFPKNKIERVGRAKILPFPKIKPTKNDSIASSPKRERRAAEPLQPEFLNINFYKIWVYPTGGGEPRSGYFRKASDSILVIQKQMVDAKDMDFQVVEIQKIKIREDKSFLINIVLGGIFGGITGGVLGVAVGGILENGCKQNCGWGKVAGLIWGVRIGAPAGAIIGLATTARKITFPIEGKKERYRKEFLEKIRF